MGRHVGYDFSTDATYGHPSVESDPSRDPDQYYGWTESGVFRNVYPKHRASGFFTFMGTELVFFRDGRPIDMSKYANANPAGFYGS